MIALECENVRDLQNVLLDFKCDNRNNRFLGSRQSNLAKSNGLSLSMVSISSSGKGDIAKEWGNQRDPDVWSPLANEK